MNLDDRAAFDEMRRELAAAQRRIEALEARKPVAAATSFGFGYLKEIYDGSTADILVGENDPDSVVVKDANHFGELPAGKCYPAGTFVFWVHTGLAAYWSAAVCPTDCPEGYGGA